MAEQSYNLKYTGKEIDDLLDKANDMNSSAQVPTGGTSGQVLTKKSGTDYDAEWKTPGSSLPSGGTPSQVLTKKSTAAGDAEWRDAPVQLPAGGYAGQILQKKSSTRNDAGWVDMPSSENPLPTGGSAGQALVKNSATNYDVKWETIQSGGGGGSGGITKTELWVSSSSSPTSQNETDLTLNDNIRNYKIVYAVFVSTGGSTLITGVQFLNLDNPYKGFYMWTLFAENGNTRAMRLVNDTSIHIYDGQNNQGYTDNTACVVTGIYGIK